MIEIQDIDEPTKKQIQEKRESDIRYKVDDLAEDLDLSITHVKVLKGLETSHSNAYVDGMCCFKNIILYDSLIKDYSSDE
jgi:STE24 endopeptidase